MHQLLNLLFRLVLVSLTVDLNELVDCQVAAAHSDHDRLTLNLHEHSFSLITVNTFRFPLKPHFLPQPKWRFVDIVAQLDVDWIRNHRLVDTDFHVLLGDQVI